ncbi:hypothetical protein EMIHUDRAFT_202612 [Emiliania huxleyi CCMP1516]|uniref:BAH domain-containing protein n=2 Tax=Emiliania huxleyi TaxID=2903 RepID=A0A0D3K8H0_EMIH1|nr:hypothetical protein EMIHUDRAFT_202612 [Emiliania huxleyi CCMP1516]EOD32055.1 hypothetical protein EMIHUDRAFT_202612 [Emiliania huxleyi CCMP1516]|eukprot:XP_005784484.1 hypothetical protein EMIHUDRAFT_202612 [Emiliania huxleyi CCMP1516]
MRWYVLPAAQVQDRVAGGFDEAADGTLSSVKGNAITERCVSAHGGLSRWPPLIDGAGAVSGVPKTRVILKRR